MVFLLLLTLFKFLGVLSDQKVTLRRSSVFCVLGLTIRIFTILYDVLYMRNNFPLHGTAYLCSTRLTLAPGTDSDPSTQVRTIGDHQYETAIDTNKGMMEHIRGMVVCHSTETNFRKHECMNQSADHKATLVATCRTSDNCLTKQCLLVFSLLLLVLVWVFQLLEIQIGMS